eukprot:TRINITY_DN4805_c0_g1_i1.p1 TRINITY_DN4805_c0_g1~~TRINITY_DN4805_c0_g1_i1.p1  ORF type:complete len:141 (+),score=15.59 TRINITY_DN4805_c0_g1_i1:394-816(+)
MVPLGERHILQSCEFDQDAAYQCCCFMYRVLMVKPMHMDQQALSLLHELSRLGTVVEACFHQLLLSRSESLGYIERDDWLFPTLSHHIARDQLLRKESSTSGTRVQRTGTASRLLFAAMADMADMADMANTVTAEEALGM